MLAAVAAARPLGPRVTMRRSRPQQDSLSPSERRRAWVESFRNEGGVVLSVYLPKEANDRLIELIGRHELPTNKTDVIIWLIMNAPTSEDGEPKKASGKSRRKLGKRGGRRRTFVPNPT